MSKLRTAALSDIGNLRTHNEDRYLRNEALGLYGVADGIGGLPGGEEAAQCAVEEVTRGVAGTPNGTEPNLTAIVQAANERVIQLGMSISPAMGIGSTLTFARIQQGQFQLAHVGDSRCYVWSKGNIELLTRDHSVESDARVRRARGEIVSYHEANRNALTRCMGQPTPPEVDLLTRPIAAGERYLLCTDGVTRLIRDSEIGEFLAQDKPPEQICKDLIALANRRGGPDNSTTVLVIVDEA
jgi:serine/threonine protein phosphatase PrpC